MGEIIKKGQGSNIMIGLMDPTTVFFRNVSPDFTFCGQKSQLEGVAFDP